GVAPTGGGPARLAAFARTIPFGGTGRRRRRAERIRNAAGQGAKLGLGVGLVGDTDGGAEHAGAAPLLGLGGHDVVDEGHQVGVEALVAADAAGQVPGVDEVVG